MENKPDAIYIGTINNGIHLTDFEATVLGSLIREHLASLEYVTKGKCWDDEIAALKKVRQVFKKEKF